MSKPLKAWFKKTAKHAWCMLAHGKFHKVRTLNQPDNGCYIDCIKCHTTWWEPL